MEKDVKVRCSRVPDVLIASLIFAIGLILGQGLSNRNAPPCFAVKKIAQNATRFCWDGTEYLKYGDDFFVVYSPDGSVRNCNQFTFK